MATSEPERTESTPSLGALAYVLVHKQVILLLRYPVNTATRFVSLVIFFGLILFGGRTVAGPAFSDSLGGVIVGFFVWTLAIVAYSGLAWNVTREAQWGTLERLFMSPHGFGTVMATQTLVNVFMSVLWAGSLLLVMMAMADRWLAVDPVTVGPLVVLTLASIVGIGFAFAGLALVYKRIENVFQLVQFGFIALIAAPVGSYEWLRLLPISHGSYLLRQAMDGGLSLGAIPATELGVLVVTSTGYLLAGYYCFHRAQLRARRDGLLGQY
ncbi:MAG: ABC transporter permease [Halalkalicoccus sp.]